ncbi:hypothetical protein HF206_07560 [Rhizobium leguminosarum]|uniref:hypothetical protein n=1 Tax=Rhizobium leguminosarum TaxID=384 RepID=UPI001C90EC52|nr:hypothetical protein [Rhizobium leguminosarum]MBY2913977.1 hypothetical protein [Rhizobium leguminosarum]
MNSDEQFSLNILGALPVLHTIFPSIKDVDVRDRRRLSLQFIDSAPNLVYRRVAGRGRLIDQGTHLYGLLSPRPIGRARGCGAGWVGALPGVMTFSLFWRHGGNARRPFLRCASLIPELTGKLLFRVRRVTVRPSVFMPSGAAAGLPTMVSTTAVRHGNLLTGLAVIFSLGATPGARRPELPMPSQDCLAGLRPVLSAGHSSNPITERNAFEVCRRNGIARG